MARQAKPRRPITGVPVLAMVDAFVGATAILLILIILSSNLDPQDGAQPRADLTLQCTDGLVQPHALPAWLPAPEAPMAPDAAAAWLAATPAPDRLMLRIRLQADLSQARCALGFQNAARDANDATDDTENRDLAIARTILLVDLQLVDQPTGDQP